MLFYEFSFVIVNYCPKAKLTMDFFQAEFETCFPLRFREIKPFHPINHAY